MLQCTRCAASGAWAAQLPRPCSGPIDWPRHVRGAFPVVRRSATGANRASRAGAARRTRPARPVRLHPAARRPPPERIRAALRGAAGLADRLHRLGRRRRRAAPTAPRCSSTAATRCRPATQVDTSVFAIVHDRRDAAGPLARSRTCRRAPSSATTRGCTPSTAPSGWRAPAPMPARRWCRPSPIRSTRSGPTGRRRRSARWRCTTSASPAKYASAKLARIRAEIADAARRRAGDLRPARGGLDLQHPRRRRRAHAAAARLRHRAAARAGRRSTSTARKLSNAVRHKLEEVAEVREPADFIRDLAALGSAQAHRAARPGDRRRRAVAHRHRAPAAR